MFGDLEAVRQKIEAQVGAHEKATQSNPARYVDHILASVKAREAKRDAPRTGDGIFERFLSGRATSLPEDETIAVIARLGFLERSGIIGGEYNGISYVSAVSWARAALAVKRAEIYPLDLSADADVIWDHLRQACRLGHVSPDEQRFAMPDCDVYDFGSLFCAIGAN